MLGCGAFASCLASHAGSIPSGVRKSLDEAVQQPHLRPAALPSAHHHAQGHSFAPHAPISTAHGNPPAPGKEPQQQAEAPLPPSLSSWHEASTPLRRVPHQWQQLRSFSETCLPEDPCAPPPQPPSEYPTESVPNWKLSSAHEHSYASEEDCPTSPEAHPSSPRQLSLAAPAATPASAFEHMPSSAPAASYMAAVEALTFSPNPPSGPHPSRHRVRTKDSTMREPGQQHGAAASTPWELPGLQHGAAPTWESEADPYPSLPSTPSYEIFLPKRTQQQQQQQQQHQLRSPRTTLGRPSLSVQLPHTHDAANSPISPEQLPEASSPRGAAPPTCRRSIGTLLPRCASSPYPSAPAPSPPLAPSPSNREKSHSRSQHERVHFAHVPSVFAAGSTRFGPGSTHSSSHSFSVPSPPPGAAFAGPALQTTSSSSASSAIAAAAGARRRRAVQRTRSALSLCPTSAVHSSPGGSQAPFAPHSELAKSMSAEPSGLAGSAVRNGLMGCSPPPHDSGFAAVRHVLQMSHSHGAQLHGAHTQAARMRMQPTPPQGGSSQQSLQGVRRSSSFSRPRHNSIEFPQGGGQMGGMQQVLSATRNALQHCNTAHSRNSSRRGSLSRALAREHSNNSSNTLNAQALSPGSGSTSPVASNSAWVLPSSSPKQHSFMHQPPPSLSHQQGTPSTQARAGGNAALFQRTHGAYGLHGGSGDGNGPTTPQPLPSLRAGLTGNTVHADESVCTPQPGAARAPKGMPVRAHSTSCMSSATAAAAVAAVGVSGGGVGGGSGTSSGTASPVLGGGGGGVTSGSPPSRLSSYLPPPTSIGVSTAPASAGASASAGPPPPPSTAKQSDAAATAVAAAALQPPPWAVLQGPPSAPPLGASRLRAGSALNNSAAALQAEKGPVAVGATTGKGGPGLAKGGPGQGGGARDAALRGPCTSLPAMCSSSSFGVPAISSTEVSNNLSREELEHEF